MGQRRRNGAGMTPVKAGTAGDTEVSPACPLGQLRRFVCLAPTVCLSVTSAPVCRTDVEAARWVMSPGNGHALVDGLQELTAHPIPLRPARYLTKLG